MVDVRLLLGPGVTFQLQLPSSHQVALQSQLPVQGPPGGLRGFGSQCWHPPSFSQLGPAAAADLPSAHTAGTLPALLALLLGPLPG